MHSMQCNNLLNASHLYSKCIKDANKGTITIVQYACCIVWQTLMSNSGLCVCKLLRVYSDKAGV